MDLKQKDRIGEAIQIINGIRDLCILLEVGKDIPHSAFVVLQTAAERAVSIMEEAVNQ